MDDLSRRLIAIVLLSAACSVVGQTTEPAPQPQVQFLIEPRNVCLNFYSGPVPPAVFYCKVAGLTDRAEVMWLRNEVPIAEEEYQVGNYSLVGNQTSGDFDLEVLGGLTRSNDRSRYACAVYLVPNASLPAERTLLKQSQTAKLKMNYYVPDSRYPECSIKVPSVSESSPMSIAAPFKDGMSFMITCCSETVNPKIELVWFRLRSLQKIQLASMNASRKTHKEKDACLNYNIVDHGVGDTYTCQLTIHRIPERRGCRDNSRGNENMTSFLNPSLRSCQFHERSINLVQQNENDATFTCFSSGAIQYLWEFVPPLDKAKNQYHLSEDSVLLNLDNLSARQYNITCTALGPDSIGSRSLIIEIGQLASATHDIIKIVSISLGGAVLLTLLLLILYLVKVRVLNGRRKGNPGRTLSSQEMRARIQIRRNGAGNSGSLYAFPSSRMTSSSITPLMEGPEDTGSSAEHGPPPSPRPPRPGLVPPSRLNPESSTPAPQGAVGGIILDEDELVECKYDDDFESEESEPDPKSMNVEGLQYADLEFSEDEDDIKDNDDGSEGGEGSADSKGKGATAATATGRPIINYANIVHFDPRKNTDPRRNSEVSRGSDSRRNSADPWRKM